MTLNHIKVIKISIHNTRHTQHTKILSHEFTFSKIRIFKNQTCIRISVFSLFVWPASGGPKILVYIYIWKNIYRRKNIGVCTPDGLLAGTV